MILEIHNFTQNEIEEKLFQRVAEVTLRTLKIDGKAEISLAIVGHGRMRRLNKLYRKKNRVTDVLSFGGPACRQAGKSVLPYLAKSFPRIKKGQKIEFVQPPDGVKRLGEVILCYPQAKKQAKRLGHSLEKELTILLVHGILHLLGYEHERGGKAEEEMKEMEKRVLAEIKG